MYDQKLFWVDTVTYKFLLWKMTCWAEMIAQVHARD